MTKAEFIMEKLAVTNKWIAEKVMNGVAKDPTMEIMGRTYVNQPMLNRVSDIIKERQKTHPNIVTALEKATRNMDGTVLKRKVMK